MPLLAIGILYTNENIVYKIVIPYRVRARAKLSCIGVVHILRNQQRGRGFQMITVDYGRGAGLAVDYVIKILIFTLIPI